jgi:hypothetical protein
LPRAPGAEEKKSIAGVRGSEEVENIVGPE